MNSLIKPLLQSLIPRIIFQLEPSLLHYLIERCSMHGWYLHLILVVAHCHHGQLGLHGVHLAGHWAGQVLHSPTPDLPQDHAQAG